MRRDELEARSDDGRRAESRSESRGETSRESTGTESERVGCGGLTSCGRHRG